jgi:hypothetical protein
MKKNEIFTFNQKMTWEFLGPLCIILLFYIAVFAVKEGPNEKPIYKDSSTAIEYMLNHLKDPSTKEEIVSSKISVWVSSCIDYNDTANQVAFRVKLNINKAEGKSLYFVKIPTGWVINPENGKENRKIEKIEKKEEEIIKIAYRHF